jgi:hypothetical protein
MLGVGKKIASGARNTGSFASGAARKTAIGAGMAGAVGLGFANEVGSAAVDASMDIAFGAPDADRYFTGREISNRYLAGRLIGGPVGTAMQATDPLAAMDYAGGTAVPGATATMAGGAIGAVGGGIAGAKMGGLKGGIAGAVLGGIAGGSMPAVNAGMAVSSNREFFQETAYGRSMSQNNAMAISAVGDIVLGMHNSRNGY